MLPAKQLSHFHAVARHGHFGHAAREAHISQSALSRSIQALERSIGVPLFKRGKDGVRLTRFGEILLSHVEVILSEEARARHEIDSSRHGRDQVITVGLGAYVAEFFGIEAAARIRTDDGRPLCRVHQGDFREVTNDVLTRRVDLAVADLASARYDDRLQCEQMSSAQMFAYVRPGHPLLARDSVSAADVFSYPMIGTRLPLRVEGPRFEASHSLDPINRDLLPFMNSASPATTLKMMREVDAVGFAALSMIDEHIARGEIAVVPVKIEETRLDTGLIYLRDRELSPAMLRFMEIARQVKDEKVALNDELEKKYGLAG